MKSLSPMENQSFIFPSQIDFSRSIVSFTRLCFFWSQWMWESYIFLVTNSGSYSFALCWAILWKLTGYCLWATSCSKCFKVNTNRSSFLRCFCFANLIISVEPPEGGWFVEPANPVSSDIRLGYFFQCDCTISWTLNGAFSIMLFS